MLFAGKTLTTSVVIGLFLSLAAGCSHKTAQGRTIALDADVDDGLGGTGIESGDVRAAADRIARALIKDTVKDKSTKSNPRIAVLPVKNHTRFRIDPGLVHDQLVHDLTQHSKGRFGIAQVRGDKPSTTANAVLRTDLRSLTKSTGDETSDFVQYFFALEDARDGSVLWTGMYETKRASQVDVVYR